MPTSSATLPSLNTLSVSVCCVSSVSIRTIGSGMSVSVGSLAPLISGRSLILPPSITSGPNRFATTCSWAGKNISG